MATSSRSGGAERIRDRSPRAAAFFLLPLWLAVLCGCASRSANPSLDDCSDGVLSFAERSFEEMLAGMPSAQRFGPGAVWSGIGVDGEARRFDLGALAVSERSGAPARRPDEDFAASLGRLRRAFSSVDRREIRLVGFERSGATCRAVLRPLLEGPSAGGGRRLETGLWEVQLVRNGESWRFSSLRQLFWRSAVCLRPLFEDRTGAAGLAGAVHRAARPGAALNVPIPGEHLPPGIAVLDFDGDGREDFFVADGMGSRLFRNRGNGTFEEVGAKAGVRGHVEAEALGALAFDFDNDGWPDLYVCYLDGPNLLYRNRGDGTFEEIGARAGVGISDWCTSAVAFDYDRDGFPDLYVLVYGRPEHGPTTSAKNAGPNHLFHNNGDGTFTEVTAASGTGDKGWSLAVASFDADEDGWPDLYIANDFGANVLYRNQRDGTFRNVARAAGVVDHGFGMGVAVADYDGDGHLDFYVSNFSMPERWFLRDRRFPMPPFPYSLGRPFVWRRLAAMTRGSSLFRWTAPARFERTSDAADVWDTSWSWGTVFLDALLRGRPDLYVVNGMVAGKNRTEHEVDFMNAMSRNWIDLERHGKAPADFGDDSLWGHLPKRFYVNLDGRRFADVAGIVGLQSEGNQRGLAVLDVDGDGAPDLLAAGFLQPPQLFMNLNPEANRSLVVELVGDSPAVGSKRVAGQAFLSTRDALGAVVRVETAGLPFQTQVVQAGNSFLSSSSKKLFFGLGKNAKAGLVTVRWPSGKVTELRDVPAGALVIREGG